MLKLYPQPLTEVKENGQEWCLGTICISKVRPIFRAGYGHDLGARSRFYKVPIDSAGDQNGWAAIFRAFDPASANPQVPEYVVGWVPQEREHDLDGWLEFLNTEIAKRLASVGEIVPSNGTEPIYVGAFKELGYDDVAAAPSLSDVRGKRPADHKAEVVQYLRGGWMLVFSPGIDRDIFDETKAADTPSVVTDGTYSWPKLLAYYVEHYDISLPADFEAHMQLSAWRIHRGSE
jgi:hypothetical protein